ncbi:MAG: hypothetical protein Q8L06_05820, partial [Pseudohongiella sp.]|nr:hypothetical protein [Pseudohongiella sp.]
MSFTSALASNYRRVTFPDHKGLFQPIKNNYWSKRMQAGHLGKALCLTALAAVSGLLWAQTSYEPPRTEWGVPDLQGNWSIATQTTLERPDRYNGKLVLTEEEAQQFEAAVQARNQAANAPSDPSREPPREGVNVGGYNNFWMDPGERLIRVNGEIRTSIMIDPPDGKLPYNDTGRANHQTTMAIREGYDGPEVR